MSQPATEHEIIALGKLIRELEHKIHELEEKVEELEIVKVSRVELNIMKHRLEEELSSPV